MKTIGSLKLGLRILRFFGLAPFRINGNQLELSATSRNYSIILMCVFVALFGYSFVFERLENNLEATVSFILLVLVNFAILLTILESLWKRFHQKEILDNFQQIDHILQTRFGHSIQEHLRAHLRNTIGVCVLIITAILTADIAIVWKLNATSEINSLAFYFLGYTFSTVRYVQIMYITWMIRKRLKFLNTTLIKLVHQKNGAIKTVSFSNTVQSIRFLKLDIGTTKNKVAPLDLQLNHVETNLTELEVLRDIYNKLWINAQLFNRAFGLSLLVNIGYDFMALTSNLYWIIVSFSTVVANVSPTPALYGELEPYLHKIAVV